MIKPARLSYTIEQAQEATGLGRTSIYKEISSGKLDARKAGRRTLITAASVQAYVASLPPALIRRSRRSEQSS